MSPRNVIDEPTWQADSLGLPTPDSPHAVSVSLPRWEDVVGYEEGNPDVISRMQAGYPRFFVNRDVKRVSDRMAPGQPCLPFPSRRAAEACAAFVSRESGADTHLTSDEGLYGVATSHEGAASLRAFWQHSGLIVSSRQAQAHLERRAADADAHVHESLRGRVAELYQVPPEDVFLYPTGMAAMLAIVQAINAFRPSRPTLQLGFPYVDSLKVQEKLGTGARFLASTEDLDAIARILEEERPAACFCEIPGNPLLSSPDFSRLVPLLRERDVPLVADDVVATPCNVDLSEYADFTWTSLTKFFAGSGDVMGGAIICNPASRYHDAVRQHVETQFEPLLWPEDAAVLDRQIQGMPERMKRHNAAGLYLAERLREHPAVEQVWYPRWECAEAYEGVRRPEGGWGALLSFLPKDAASKAPRIYDALRICKGPTLGTVFTLACPFTLLAHYGELDWAESCGVSRYLIRVSVGIEEPEALWKRFEPAFSGAAGR